MTASFAWSGCADWLCTFALHSTCALAVALSLSVVLRRRAVAAQEQLLRFSLWVALPSSAVQFFVLGGPWPAGLSLPSSPITTAAAPFPALDIEPMFDVAAVPALASASPAAELPWALLVVAVAITCALFGLCWLWSVHQRLRRVLALRLPETDSRVLTTAAEVAREQGLRQSPHLSRCEGLATPIAFGWMRPEICLPLRASELGSDSLRAMLAHEIAHLRRGDPAWMWLAAALQALFPWQLLMVVVRRRWARLVELRCDAIAAGHSSPTAVARCLLDVAEWLRPAAHTPMVALGMAARASSLRERVEAALHSQVRQAPHRFASLGFSVLSLSALTVAGPGVHSGAATEAAGAPEVPADLASDEVFASATLDTALRDAVSMLEVERVSLAAEAQQLRADLAARPSSPELELLLATLQRRLVALERMSSRLRARLERSVHEAR